MDSEHYAPACVTTPANGVDFASRTGIAVLHAAGLSESKTEAGNHVWILTERMASFSRVEKLSDFNKPE